MGTREKSEVFETFMDSCTNARLERRTMILADAIKRLGEYRFRRFEKAAVPTFSIYFKLDIFSLLNRLAYEAGCGEEQALDSLGFLVEELHDRIEIAARQFITKKKSHLVTTTSVQFKKAIIDHVKDYLHSTNPTTRFKHDVVWAASLHKYTDLNRYSLFMTSGADTINIQGELITQHIFPPRNQ